MRLLILLVGCLLSFGFSQKLSTAEDEERSKTCGRIPNQNAKTNDELSPWTVRIQIKDKHFNPATLVSKRHILSSGSIVIGKVANEEKWKWSMNGEEIDMANCKDNKMEVPTELLTVDLVACSNHFLCPWRPEVPIRSVESDISIAIDEQLTSHKAHIDNNQNIVIEMLPTTIIACSTPSDHLFCGELSKCPEGSTSPLIKRVDGVDTVVGFSVYYNDECKKKTFASVMHYKQQLCDLTGICQKTSPGPYAPKQIPPPTEISLSNKFIKLTKSEDVANTESCGKPTNPGSSLPIDLTPWTVNVNTPNDNGYIYNPATLISKRHVVVAAFALFQDKPAKYFDGTAVDLSKCQNNVMEISTEIIKKTSVDLSTCNDASKCGSQVSKQVKSVIRSLSLSLSLEKIAPLQAVYFGVCEPEVRAFGVVLLEMDSDLPAELPYFVPSCIPEKKVPEVDDSLHLHSIGQDENKQYTRRISMAQTGKCTKGYRMYCQICATQTDCNEHSNGGFSRTQNGREVLIGVMYYHDSTCKVEDLVSMEVLSELFCLYAGICNTKLVLRPWGSRDSKLVSLIVCLSARCSSWFFEVLTTQQDRKTEEKIRRNNPFLKNKLEILKSRTEQKKLEMGAMIRKLTQPVHVY
ncbi:hypothetical protein CRE_29460 [Caenorhabditis remanei]|uniref:Uncharacterized protein n=1 Tax=Caenorhabditis remanei TaxID=31234 RepID=E3LV45_CAERE|nr:hypothetical protein CRE_29460 [Caenorhabditis remanei]